MRVLICDNLDPAGVEVFTARPGFEVDVRNDLDHEALVAEIGRYDGLVVRSKTRVTADVIAAAERLKVVGRAGTGVDNIDVAAATRRGIVVMNAAAGNSVTTAEHAMALLLALARQIPAASASTKAGRWEKKRFLGVEVQGKTLGIVGVGRIGSILAQRAIGLRMHVIAYDPYLPRESAAKVGFDLVDLDELLARSDFISIHTPLTDETRGLIGRRAFSTMKDRVRVINCARGGLVDEAALFDAIVSGKVAGAALDVFDREPVAADNPLLGLDEVIATPHLGASTEEAQQGVAVLIAEQMVEFLEAGTVRGAVNVPALNAEQLEQLGPAIGFAETLGRFSGQAFGHDPVEVRIEFSGEVAEYDVNPLVQAALVGLFAPVLDGINVINAAVVAAERGVRVTMSTNRHSRDYASTVTLGMRTSDGEHEVVGAFFGAHDTRIVRVDGIEIEAVPEGHLVLFTNRDVPGVIGQIATYLGDAGINIGQFYLGRKERGVEAMALIETDEPISEAQLAALAATPNVLSARRIELAPLTKS